MSKHPNRTGELIGPADGGGWNVYDKTTDSLHMLNDSARAIWELCDGETSPDEMADAVAELTGLRREDAQTDVSIALGELRSLGLVS